MRVRILRFLAHLLTAVAHVAFNLALWLWAAAAMTERGKR